MNSKAAAAQRRRIAQRDVMLYPFRSSVLGSREFADFGVMVKKKKLQWIFGRKRASLLPEVKTCHIKGKKLEPLYAQTGIISMYRNTRPESMMMEDFKLTSEQAVKTIELKEFFPRNEVYPGHIQDVVEKRGFGAPVLKKIISLAKSTGNHYLVVETHRPFAQKSLLKAGFEPVKVEPFRKDVDKIYFKIDLRKVR